MFNHEGWALMEGKFIIISQLGVSYDCYRV